MHSSRLPANPFLPTARLHCITTTLARKFLASQCAGSLALHHTPPHPRPPAPGGFDATPEVTKRGEHLSRGQQGARGLVARSREGCSGRRGKVQLRTQLRTHPRGRHWSHEMAPALVDMNMQLQDRQKRASTPPEDPIAPSGMAPCHRGTCGPMELSAGGPDEGPRRVSAGRGTLVCLLR